jgi:hypothetical protein
MESCKSHFENFKFNLQHHLTNIQNQAASLVQQTQQKIKDYFDTLLTE